ncbi:hypothetical protein EVAR_10087_1 [Eumeta japonica]|uniref:Uncharacterized protein n=1 Tax=Eumeta variegata TaxID=151549 RepID=A0A4C1UDG6_EUMVA|nr:hypothetical protein EVAR_10087_1 [Eumeta japonica]
MDSEPGSSTKKGILSPPKKSQRTAMSVSEKPMIMNIYKYAYKNWPKNQYWSLSDCDKNAAELLGISAVKFRRILKENRTGEEFTSSHELGPKRNILDEVDEFAF